MESWYWEEAHDICRTHGIDFLGSKCPLCAIDKVLGRGEAPDPHRHLAAQAKALEAHDLLRRGKLDEALITARQVLAQDPHNLRAYMVAAWALDKKGFYLEAKRVFLKQIDLLNLDVYAQNYHLVEEVFNGLPPDAALERPFSKVVSFIWQCWPTTESNCARFVQSLIDRGLLQLTENGVDP